MIEKFARCLMQRPPHVRITKWLLTYSQANNLAHEVYAMRGPATTWQSPGDILMSIIHGEVKMLAIPVEVKCISGRMSDPWLVDLGGFGTAVTFDGEHVPLSMLFK